MTDAKPSKEAVKVARERFRHHDSLTHNEAAHGVCVECFALALDAFRSSAAGEAGAVRDGYYYCETKGAGPGSVWFADHGDGVFVKDHPEPHYEAARLNAALYAKPDARGAKEREEFAKAAIAYYRHVDATVDAPNLEADAKFSLAIRNAYDALAKAGGAT